MKKICGIYKITNNKNKLVYVGQSVDIFSRWTAHKMSANNTKKQDHNTKIHKAMYNLGIENFEISIIEECDYVELNQREIYWIKYYDSYNNGYNMTLGGDSYRGECNGRHLLTESQVVEIRLAYANRIRFKEVYEKYKNIISKRGLQKVWHFETWKHILPEVYTDENRQWHATMAKANINDSKELVDNNAKRACSQEEIQKIRELRNQGLSYNKIALIMSRSYSVVRKYCLFEEAKNPIWGITTKNIETGLIFNGQTEASKWANCDRHLINKNINTNKSAGIVPSTGEPAHWISL